MTKETMEIAASVYAALARGCKVTLKDRNTGTAIVFTRENDCAEFLRPSDFEHSYDVVSVEEPAPWGREDAKKHAGFAFRDKQEGVYGIIGFDVDGWEPWFDGAPLWNSWSGYEYATPKWDTPVEQWDWKPCRKEIA